MVNKRLTNKMLKKHSTPNIKFSSTGDFELPNLSGAKRAITEGSYKLPKLEVDGAISSAVGNISASADNTDVSDINTLFIDSSGATVVIGGFTGGVAGQTLLVVHKTIGNDLTLEHIEGVGDQDLYMHDASDETINNYGGFTLVCDGSNWYDVSHAKHV